MVVKIIKLDDIPPALEQALTSQYEVTDIDLLPLEATPHEWPDFVIGVANGESQLPASLLCRFPGLKLIAIFGVGYDGVDLAYLQQNNITLTNTAGVLTDDVADLAVALALALCREVLQAHYFVSSGQWQQSRYPLTHKFSGKKIGILGMGRVGQAICKRLLGFGCQVFYCGSREYDVAATRLSSLNNLADTVDILILSASANSNNRAIIDLNVLTRLGRDGLLVNVARGSLVNQSDLICALTEKIIAGAALDVLNNEPDVPQELLRRDVILTPHYASGTVETREAMAKLVVNNISLYLQTGQVLTPVLSAG